ncbi:hypothetical protein AURDEDRAFT_115849 [Auricularia subglabra TFB-10046 SS5]|nr:hypothetical protein AURDEDRAFT_115849 [Auricularia subglabra TFB-10046 SS5]
MVTTLDPVPAGSGRSPDENPPPYMNTERKPETDAPEKDGDALPVTAPQLAPDIPRCNLLNISRPDGRIAGQFVVDPALQVSDALLAPLPPEEMSGGARPNLRLATNRGVDAEVWVLDAGASASAVRLVFVSKREHVRIRLHTLGNQPCFVEIRAAGNARVILPRNFVGTVWTRTTRGPATIPARFATLSEVDGEGKYFRGPMSGIGASGWHGTSVDIAAPVGKITVLLAGDPEPSDCIVS